MVPLDPYRISLSGAGAPTQLTSFLTKALLSARAHSYICVLACELKAPNNPTRLATSSTANYDTVKSPGCEEGFFFFGASHMDAV